MSDEKTQSTESAQSKAQPRADRGNKENARSRESGAETEEQRGTKKAQDLVRDAQTGQRDAGEEIAKACTARALALHAILSNRLLQP